MYDSLVGVVLADGQRGGNTGRGRGGKARQFTKIQISCISFLIFYDEYG
jgi:hypothetical protein